MLITDPLHMLGGRMGMVLHLWMELIRPWHGHAVSHLLFDFQLLANLFVDRWTREGHLEVDPATILRNLANGDSRFTDALIRKVIECGVFNRYITFLHK